MIAANPARTTPLFRADPAHVRWLGDHIVNALGTAEPARVLDVGCGDGTLLLYLAEALPRSSCVGIDLSDANIAAATSAITASPHRSRIDFIHGDYLRVAAGPFDLIVASSSLQGIDATTDQLAAKLASDLCVGGCLMHVTPYRCPYNSALSTVRAGLRAMRGRTTDALILAAARLLHPAQPAAKLRERLGYMYLQLRHYEDDIRAALERRGLRLLSIEPAPHTSAGQPKHRLAVMSRPARD